MGRKGSGKKRKGHQSNQSSQSAQQGAPAAKSSQNSSQQKAQPEAQPRSQTKGRLVITHSTYIPGLIPLLEKLANCPGIQTITPAVISRVKSNAPKFRLKVSVPITGGYKLIARHRKSAQEVFVITQWSKEELEQAINRLLG